MERKEIQAKVIGIVEEKLGISRQGEVTPESLLGAEGLGADSLDVIEIVMAIEEQFDIMVPDEDVDSMKTVKDVVDYLGSKV